MCIIWLCPTSQWLMHWHRDFMIPALQKRYVRQTGNQLSFLLHLKGPEIFWAEISFFMKTFLFWDVGATSDCQAFQFRTFLKEVRNYGLHCVRCGAETVMWKSTMKTKETTNQQSLQDAGEGESHWTFDVLPWITLDTSWHIYTQKKSDVMAWNHW